MCPVQQKLKILLIHNPRVKKPIGSKTKYIQANTLGQNTRKLTSKQKIHSDSSLTKCDTSTECFITKCTLRQKYTDQIYVIMEDEPVRKYGCCTVTRANTGNPE